MLHRRSALALVASAAFVSLAGIPARAQGWSVFRRDDIGFTIELPGTPKFEEVKHEAPDGKSYELELDHEGLQIGASQTERPQDLSSITDDQWLDEVSKHVGVLEFRLFNDRRFTFQNFPAADLTYGTDGLHGFSRNVVTPQWLYSVTLMGAKPIAEDPVATRVLNSFALV